MLLYVQVYPQLESVAGLTKESNVILIKVAAINPDVDSCQFQFYNNSNSLFSIFLLSNI